VKFAIYNSRALALPFQDTDMEILHIALVFNAAHGITGFLHRSANHYYQYLEGPRQHIDALLARIAKDTRHTNFQFLQTGNNKQRRFRNWSMEYSQAASKVQRKFLALNNNGQDVSEFLHRESMRQQTVRSTEEPN